MFIIEVIPIAKNVGVESLSYFTTKDVPIGAVVTIPLRKKLVKGIVVSLRPAEDLKSEIKNSTFALKKLDKVKSTNFFTPEFMDMSKIAADYYATSVGGILDILAPEYILKNIGKLKTIKEKEASPKIVQEKYVVQGDEEERYGTWKSLIRQEFAKKKSVFFLFPTIEEAEYGFKHLEKGIEGYAFLLHGGIGAKEIVTVWNNIMKEDHPVAVIATGGFLSLPREDIGTFVIEKESSRSYKILRRPYLDVRHVAEILAEKRSAKLFLADSFLRLETLFRHDEGELIEASPFKFRSLSTARDTLIDMRQYKDQNRNVFKILSPEVESLITHTKEQSEHMIVLAVRRGMSSSTVCGDCQNIVMCTNCSAPVVLHGNSFLCHRCGERRSADEVCKICGSWKLGSIGIGIDLVEKKIKDKFPDITLFKIDSDTVKSDAAAHALIHKFRAQPGSILLGTEMMLQYIHDKVENSVVVSLDSLFALPDFRIQERILSILITMRTLSTRNIIAQTRKAEEKVFEYGIKGNTSDFYKIALEERKQFNYPPYSLLIKLTLEGKKDDIVKEMEEIQTLMEPLEVDVFPAFTHTIKGNFVLHGLIRIEKDRWPQQSILDKLRSLSPSVTVKIDPESLL